MILGTVTLLCTGLRMAGIEQPDLRGIVCCPTEPAPSQALQPRSYDRAANVILTVAALPSRL
jgi:hypothetical protein